MRKNQGRRWSSEIEIQASALRAIIYESIGWKCQASEWPQSMRALVFWQEATKKAWVDIREGERMEMRIEKSTLGDRLED